MKILKKEKKKDKEEKVETKPAASSEAKASYLVKRPWISEKSTALREERAHVFLVRAESNKKEVGKEIGKRYGVTVEGVRIIKKEGKTKRFGKHVGRRSNIKKAIIKLKEGDTIDIV